MSLRIASLHPDVMVPTYATPGASAFDLHAYISEPGAFVVLNPGDAHVFGTGLVFEVPQEHGLFIFSRSGHGVKQRIRMGNCVGVIDSDYRGEVLVHLTNDGRKVQRIAHGDRIAQGIVMATPRCHFAVVPLSELTTTKRGAGGFGSTGK